MIVSSPNKFLPRNEQVPNSCNLSFCPPPQNGQTALSIAQRLGYISVVETLKVVTEKEVTTTTTTTVEEKYRVMAPESMQETFMSDSEDEGGRRGMSSLFLQFQGRKNGLWETSVIS